MENERDYLTAETGRAYLGVSRTTMTRLCKRPDFPCIRLGKKIIIPRDRLDAWLAAQVGKRVKL